VLVVEVVVHGIPLVMQEMGKQGAAMAQQMALELLALQTSAVAAAAALLAVAVAAAQAALA
jgi:hypothetical protein